VSHRVVSGATSFGGRRRGILVHGIAFVNDAGRYRGWRWIFIVEGSATVVVSLLAYIFTVNYPNTAVFVSNDVRDAFQARLKAESDATRQEKLTWTNAKTVLFDYKPWLYGSAFHVMSLFLCTLGLFLVSYWRCKLHSILTSSNQQSLPTWDATLRTLNS